MRPVTKQILTFVALTAAFSAVPDALMVHAGTLGTGGGLAVAAVMWCPALAAFATCLIFRIDVASLGWNWRPRRWEWAGYLIPVLYALPAYGLAWLLIPDALAYAPFAEAQAKLWALTSHPDAATWLVSVPAMATVGVIAGTARALGEEIGWRGFLLPRLIAARGYTVGCLIGGLIWAVWHFPGLLWAGYEAGTPPLYEMACFTVMVTATTFVLGWLRLKSGSLWPCAVLHGSHNLFVQHIYDGMTATSGPVLYVTTEFGCALAIAVTLVAIWCWRRRGTLDIPDAAVFA
jgi:membrane protease YdiL (CAAX protease family)